MWISPLIIGFIVLDLLFAWFLIWAIMRAGWRPMTIRYPAREPAPNAVRRNFQSFRFGIMNLTFSVHVAVDEDHLHLMPARILRWCGAGPASIPWSAIRPGKPVMGGKWMRASIDKNGVVGPTWCLSLAAPGTPGGEDQPVPAAGADEGKDRDEP